MFICWKHRSKRIQEKVGTKRQRTSETDIGTEPVTNRDTEPVILRDTKPLPPRGKELMTCITLNGVSLQFVSTSDTEVQN